MKAPMAAAKIYIHHNRYLSYLRFLVYVVCIMFLKVSGK